MQEEIVPNMASKLVKQTSITAVTTVEEFNETDDARRNKAPSHLFKILECTTFWGENRRDGGENLSHHEDRRDAVVTTGASQLEGQPSATSGDYELHQQIKVGANVENSE